MFYNGIEIRESLFAFEDTKVPVRKLKVRRWMSLNYARRVQKKWTKRFGTVKKPRIFQISPKACGLFGPDYFVAHPAVIQQLRNAIRASEMATLNPQHARIY